MDSTQTSTKRWAFAVAGFAALAIAGHYLVESPLLHWIFKPLTTLLILAMAWSLPSATPYRRWIMIGLACSTVGDIFLMLPGDYFVHGLLSFLVAHGAYLWALRQRAPWLARGLPFLIYAGLTAVILWLLWPAIPAPLRIPVLVYVAALGAMAAQAAVAWQLHRDRACAYAALGGAFFVFSDALIAFNRFLTPFESARLLILVSYWLAQWLIARSIAHGPAATASGLTAKVPQEN